VQSVDDWDEVRRATNLAGYDGSELIRRSKEQFVSPEVLLEGIHRSAAVRAQASNGPLPPFGTFDAIPPGRIDLRVLDQSEFWVDIFAVPHRIGDRVDFTDDYLRNVIKSLLHDRVRLTRAYGEAFPERACTGSVLDWLEATTLMSGLRAEQALRQRFDSSEAKPETRDAD
jgi:hypothetical protein